MQKTTVEQRNISEEYCVVSTNTTTNLQKLVETKLNEGWRLQGGVAVV